MKKLRLLVGTAREQYYVRRLHSLNQDVKRNWKVLDSLMGKNKKSLHKEFIVDGVSTNDTTKIWNAFCNYFNDYPRNIHGSTPISTSHHLDQIEISERSMYIRNTLETDIIESFKRLDKHGGINDISSKILFILKNYVFKYLKGLNNFCNTSGVYSNVFF